MRALTPEKFVVVRQFNQFVRFGAIPFSRYRIVQGMHRNSPPLLRTSFFLRRRYANGLHHQPSLSAMVGALRRILVVPEPIVSFPVEQSPIELALGIDMAQSV